MAKVLKNQNQFGGLRRPGLLEGLLNMANLFSHPLEDMHITFGDCLILGAGQVLGPAFGCM